MIRVLIIDDSATARRALEHVFSSARDFSVVASLADGSEVVAAVKKLKPDIIAMDAVLPGVSTEKLVAAVLAAQPVPIVLVSTGSRNMQQVFDALKAGALEFVQKPSLDQPESGQALLEVFRGLSRVRVQARRARATPVNRDSSLEVLVIGSSTGGPGALQELLRWLPRRFSLPIVVAQHLTLGFEDGLAKWLSSTTGLEVLVAHQGTVLKPGAVVLGVPGCDLTFASRKSLTIGARQSQGFHPSVDALFESAAKVFGPRALAVVLSGIGADGTNGARALVARGARVLAQDRASSAVSGMPQEVARHGLADLVAPPLELALAVAEAASA